MEIEVGEFVRTKEGDIDKIDRYIFESNIYHCKNGMCIDTENRIGLHLEDIIKHSKNIIDLIEVGDYVNGRKIERVNDYGEHKRVDFNLDFDDCDAVYNENIKSILTHEQFEQNCYRLEE